MDPIHQFEIKTLIPITHSIGFTNSAFFMFLAVGAIALVMLATTSSRSIIPGRWQSLAETLFEFVAGTVRSSAGSAGMKFLPLVFSLFMFVLMTNLFGMIPGFFSVTSHIIVTFSLAALVIGTVLFYGFYKHGMHFLNLFVPSGVPGWLLPLMVVIEVISFVSRPLSLSVRLFANMLAGHIALKIFASFIISLFSAGVLTAILSPLPFALTTALVVLELLVAVLQAYVFAMLTCVYLNDAIHPGH
jgi:F-type H+-transporting ATPase subunit a